MTIKTLTTGLCAILLSATCGCHGLDVKKAWQPPLPESAAASAQADDADEANKADQETVRFQSPDGAQYRQPEFETGSMPLELGSYPIDFPTVLQLAGADNWNVKVAQQKVQEAAAEYCLAKNAWLPTITLSVGFNNHEGQLQSTEGDVLTVSRNSLFLGGGAGIANAPLNGGSGGPPRMFVDFSLADAIFKPLAARQMLGAEKARQNRVFNDTMLQASLGYYDLVQSQSRLAIVQTNLSEAQELARLTAAFVEAGKGTPADSSRVAVIVNNRRQQQVMANTELKIASAKLATILQLDPTKLDPEQGLVALDAQPVPLNLVDTSFSLTSMISQAQALRCEIAEANAATGAANSELLAEQWRPLLPNLFLGQSGGLFGGGQGGNLSDFDGRSDLDIVVSWQVKNLGFGSRAQQNISRSRVAQRQFEMQQIRDQIAEQVTTTYQRVEQFRSMTGILQENITEASSGLEKSLAAIKGLEGRPLEAISALEQLATARADYLSAVVNYNQWQIRLLRAAGQSLAPDAELGTIANCNACSNGCDGCDPECSSCLLKPPQSLKCSAGQCDGSCTATSRRKFGRKAGSQTGCSCQSGSCGASESYVANPLSSAPAVSTKTDPARQAGLISSPSSTTSKYLLNRLAKEDREIASTYTDRQTDGKARKQPKLNFGPAHRTAWHQGTSATR